MSTGTQDHRPDSNYDRALNQALESGFFALKQRDLKEVAFKSGASYSPPGLLGLVFLNRHAALDVPQRKLEIAADPVGDATRGTGTRTTILILHYLLRASGSPLTGRLIGFKEVPQGSLYYPPFRGRVIMPVVAQIEKDAEGFLQRAAHLGGESVPSGNLSVRFRVFPYVPVQYVWHAGEEGIPPELNVLFDASIPEYLSTEDIVVMCEEINRRLRPSRGAEGVPPVPSSGARNTP